MLVKDIIKAHECCYFLNKTDSCTYCQECPLRELEAGQNCQRALARFTIEKLTELTELLDDTVNHHYYDTLDYLQERNLNLTNKLDSIKEIIDAQ